MAQKLVKPILASGTRDLLPEDAIAQQDVIRRIIAVYEQFGFVPLETPCMERWGVLTGDNPSFNKSIFRAIVVRGAEDYGAEMSELAAEDTALRFDLTVPLARVISAYPSLPRPFKRYQVGKVFRGERVQAGRFREFTQLDFDIIGSSSIWADIEVLHVMYSVMRALGVEDFLIRFNTRKVLNGLAEMAGCTESRATELFRVIDKFEKEGVAAILNELTRKPDPHWVDDPALQLKAGQAECVEKFISIVGSNSEERVRLLTGFFGNSNKSAEQGVTELEEITKALRVLGIPEENCAVDLSVARGLDYYTGSVFETVLACVPKLGSVFSGGRFDGLSNRFMAGSNISGVGASVGIDRMIIGLRETGLVKNRPSTADLLVTVFKSDPELAQASMLFADRARQVGINTEVYLGDDTSFGAQFAYAAKQEIPFVAVIGPNESMAGLVQLKDMEARVQEALTEKEVFGRLQQV